MNQPKIEPRRPPANTGLNPVFEANLPGRHLNSRVWRALFQLSTMVGIIFLVLLLYTIVDQSFGYVAIQNHVDPASLAVEGVVLKDLDQATLITILQENISKGLMRQLEREKPLAERTRDEILILVIEQVVQPEIVQTWPLTESLFQAARVRAEAVQEYPRAALQFRAWFSPQFLAVPQSSDPLKAGVRTAALGSLWTIAITVLVAFPLGVGAAIYLEEYAANNWLNRAIQTNINNLAGVPSIIYGMLGLAIFVRNLEAVTSGAALGFSDPATANGRTILSAGLTLALLVLPLIIINGQEALRAVPASLRQASYGVGATLWQTVWYHVLPSAMPGILTGVILAVSRAIGETAPLVVVGAATFITFDPSSPFSKFTTLPIQIYQWTARPQAEFRNLAASAILVLLVLLLGLNAVAIILRNRFRRAGGN